MDLYDAVRGFKSPGAMIELKPEAARTVRFWRAALVALELGIDEHARPFTSLCRRGANYLIEYDASLGGIGLVVSTLDVVTGEVESQWASKIVLLYGLRDSGYQNSVEFIAIVLGLGCLAARGARDFTVRLKGDNVSSLCWSTSELFHSSRSRGAALLLMALLAHLGAQISEGEHVPGERNIVCDRLSRGGVPQDYGFSPDRTMDFDGLEQADTMLRLCDPRAAIDSERDLVEVWSEVYALAGDLSS